MKFIISFSLMFTLLVPYVQAGKEVRTYEIPDVKNAYCAVEIDFHWCKCAFHNQYCDSVNSNLDSAYAYVLQQFSEWNRQNIQSMGEQCLKNDGYWDKGNWECTYCTEGDERSGKNCVKPEKIDSEVRECKQALGDFDNNWEKYSDFDYRLGSDVSYEVGQFNETLSDIGELIAEAYEIEYAMAVEVEIRNEIKAYKQALVLNIRQNITKAIFRLAWVTYNTTKGAYGAKGSVEKLLDPANHIETAGATLKIIQGHIPPDAKKLQFDTTKIPGKIASIAWNATLEGMESTADPYEIAKQGMKDVKGAVTPGPDISPEEVAILRDQHLSKEAANEAIADSYKFSASLRAELANHKALITEKYNELQQWKLKEYQRVKVNLEDQCKDKID